MGTTAAAVLGLALSLLLVFDSQGRIGENKEQVDSRFGKPVDSVSRSPETQKSLVGKADNMFLYKTNGYVICVFFKDKNSYAESYQHDAQIKFNTLTDEQAANFLSANSNGMTWSAVELKNGEYQKAWRREDAAIAFIDLLRTSFVVLSAEAFKDALADKENEEKKALSGF